MDTKWSTNYADVPGDDDAGIFARSVEELYQYAPVHILGIAVITLFVSLHFWNENGIDQRKLLFWIAVMAILILYRITLHVYYRHRMARHSATYWVRHYVVAAMFSGIAWGILALLFMATGDLQITLFIVILLLGLQSATITATSVYYPVFFGFSVPITLCLIMGFLHLKGTHSNGLAALSIIYWMALSGYTVITGQNKQKTYRLLLENEALLDQLQQKVQEVTEANEAKTRFLASASHDLRQPLGAMNLYIGVLEQIHSTGETLEITRQLRNSLNALGRLLNSLLDISRLEAGIVKKDIQAFDLNTLLERMCEEYRLQAAEKNLKFRCIAKRKLLVRSDPALLERILRNFLANALRYTAKGGILIGCRTRSDTIWLQVWDSGIGIEPEHQKRVFDEFVQLNNTERNAKGGLGLGLAIVERIAGLLGHRIGIKSMPGKGSVFWIEVPRHQPAEEEAAPSNSASATPPQSTRLDGLDILIVDDETAIRRGLEMLIQRAGGTALSAGSGPELLKQLPSWPHRPAAIISDYRLPSEETGTEVIRKIRDYYSDDGIPALLITGDTAAERLRDVANSGFPVLHKPAEPMQIITLLHGMTKRPEEQQRA